MTHRLFEGREHAASYWKYRIAPSDQLIQQVLDFLEKRRGRPFELAVDVGCGSGQGTGLLAEHFGSVVGTDVSRAQLEMAELHAKKPNVTYRECAAEQLPLNDGSADLVTAMSAFHWFDRPLFLQEAHRILKPGGCLALLNYTMEMELSYSGCCSQALNQVCKELYAALSPFRSPHLGASSLNLYRESYQSIPYPDKEWHEHLWLKKTMPLENFMGLVESFSLYQALLRKDPQEAARLSADICQRLMSIMKVSSAAAEVQVSVPYYCMLACKPQTV